MSSLNPLQYAVYKGTGGKYGVAQFNLQPPHYYRGKQKSYDGYFYHGDQRLSVFENIDGKNKLRDGWKIREGAVFVEMTSPKGKNEYDWTQKVIFALSVNDMGKVLYFLKTGQSPERNAKEGELSIMHDPGAKSANQGQVRKYLNLVTKNIGSGCIMSLTSVQGEDKKTHKVPLTGDEVAVLGTLVQEAISSALSW